DAVGRTVAGTAIAVPASCALGLGTCAPPHAAAGGRRPRRAGAGGPPAPPARPCASCRAGRRRPAPRTAPARRRRARVAARGPGGAVGGDGFRRGAHATSADAPTGGEPARAARPAGAGLPGHTAGPAAARGRRLV